MLATEFLGYGPWARQRVVDRRDFVVQNVRIGFIEVNSLFDDSLIILVKRETAALVGAGAFQVAGLDLEHVVAAICVRIDPFADRIAGEGRLGMVGPAPPRAWSARLASKIAWYSGVSGACCPRPMGLVGSHCMPPVLSHWPDQSGYLVSSCARAAAIVVTITVASTTAPIELRTGICPPIRRWASRQKMNLLRD